MTVRKLWDMRANPDTGHVLDLLLRLLEMCGVPFWVYLR